MFRFLVVLLLVVFDQLVHAQEWQEIPDSAVRLEEASAVDTPKKQITEVPDLEDPSFYKKGEGTISGAFGILFGVPLDKDVVLSHPGWIEPPERPSQFAYYGVVKPFTMDVYLLQPPNIPKLLQAKGTRFRAYTNYRNHPIWISVNVGDNLDKVIPLLSRKYGAPTTDFVEGIDSGNSYYSDGQNMIRVSAKQAVIDYFDMFAFKDYMAQRNKSLRKKFLDSDRSRLTQYEQSLMRIADQIATQGTSFGSAFGIEFGKRVPFVAQPDSPRTFRAPVPFSDLGNGEHSITVSPDLHPISIRYEVEGSELELSLYKGLVDHALKLNFGGFLKNSANHTVISVGGRSVSAMIRAGKFSLTFIDAKGQRMMREREKIVEDRIKAAAARKQRKQEIMDEEAF